jgi:hypothetical protein
MDGDGSIRKAYTSSLHPGDKPDQPMGVAKLEFGLVEFSIRSWTSKMTLAPRSFWKDGHKHQKSGKVRTWMI